MNIHDQGFFFQFSDIKDLAKFSKKLVKLVEFTISINFINFWLKTNKICPKITFHDLQVA